MHDSFRRKDQSQLVNLVAILAEEASNLPASGRSDSDTIAGGSSSSHSVSGAGRGQNVEDASLRALLSLAQLGAGPVLTSTQGQARGGTTSATVAQDGSILESNAHGVQARAASKGQLRGLGNGGVGRELGQISEPVAVGSADVGRLAQLGGQRPGEVDADGVVVGENVAIRLQELVALVVERVSGQANDGVAAVEELVDSLAVVGGAGVGADGLHGWLDARADQLDPCVRQAVLGPEGGDVVRRARVAAVGVAKDEHGVAHAPGVDVVGDLLHVAGSGSLVAVFSAGVGVQIVRVNVDAVGNLDAHEGEALGSQAIGTRGVGAVVPLDAGEVDPVKVGQSVETRANDGAARCSSAVGMRIRLVD